MQTIAEAFELVLLLPSTPGYLIEDLRQRHAL